MRFRWIVLVAWLLGPIAPAVAAEPPELAKARALYNAGSYDAAIEAAAPVLQQPGFADAASLVTARAYLERYRQTAAAADITAARTAFGTVSAVALSPRDQVDLLIGLGQTLYLDGAYGAAAELFDTALAGSALLSDRDKLLLLDWWATALDREAQTRTADRRAGAFDRIEARMESELRELPMNAVANYWLVVAARGQGDLERAWDAAVAAWVRATLAADTAATLRADVDRLVTEALIPELSRLRPAPEQADAAAALRTEWLQLQAQWK